MSEFYQENLLRLMAMIVTAATAAAQPVSYSREVAPILAMNCNLCHGANPDSAAGGLSTRTWNDLMRGGNMGPAIVRGDPERSALYQFISGARGEAQRMPLAGKPLSAREVETIARWIREGAAAGTGDAPKYRRTIPKVKLPAQFTAVLPTEAYISIQLSTRGGKILYLDGGAVRSDRSVAAIGVPGEQIVWNLRRAPGWPSEVVATLTIEYTATDSVGVQFTAR